MPKKDPGLAILVNLAQRCRRARKIVNREKKRLREAPFGSTLIERRLEESKAAALEAWNSLQASKRIYWMAKTQEEIHNGS